MNSVYIEWILCNRQENGQIVNSNDSKSKRAYDLTTIKRSEGKLVPDFAYYLKDQIWAVVRRLLEPMENIGVNMDYLAELMGSSYHRETGQVSRELITEGAIIIDDSYFLSEQLSIPIICSSCSQT